MNSGTLSGLCTGLLIVLFLGVWAWAFGSRRRAQFDRAAQMPLEEDVPAEPGEVEP